MTILVTGANGMIGRKLVGRLLASGYFVIGIDRTDSEYHETNYIHFNLDLANKDKLKNIVDEQNIDRIIHLAALAHTNGESELTWDRYNHINVECAKNVFETAVDRPVLFISTVDVLGFYDGKKVVNGNTPINPVTNYGKSKALAEAECRKLEHFSIFRFSPVYSDEIKRDIQKRYYLKYPTIAYQIGAGTEYEVLNIQKAVQVMIDWCEVEPKNDISIIKDEKNMWTPDYIKSERENGRARIVLRFPKWFIKCGYFLLERILGENEITYLFNKAVYPLRSE